jgi:hypothetical protein
MRNGWADPIIDEAQTSGNGFETAKSPHNLCEQQPFRWWQFNLTEPKYSLFDSPISAKRMAGGYICLQGGAIMERGQWQVERIY